MIKPTEDTKAFNLVQDYIEKCGDNWDKYYTNPKLPQVISYDEATKTILKMIEDLGYHKGKTDGTTLEEGCRHLNSEFECDEGQLINSKCRKNCVYYDDGSL